MVMYKCGEDCGTSSMVGNVVNGSEGVMNNGPYRVNTTNDAGIEQL